MDKVKWIQDFEDTAQGYADGSLSRFKAFCSLSVLGLEAVEARNQIAKWDAENAPAAPADGTDHKHSPLPWRYDDYAFGTAAGIEDANRRVVITTQRNSTNAAYIVTACNEYPALKARIAELEGHVGILRTALFDVGVNYRRLMQAGNGQKDSILKWYENVKDVFDDIPGSMDWVAYSKIIARTALSKGKAET